MSFHRLLTAAALAGFVTALAGCGTLIGRQNDHVDIFPGLQQDGAFLGVTGVNEPYNPSGAATILCYITIICVPVTLLSIPVDAAIDTVLLPIDLADIANATTDNR